MVKYKDHVYDASTAATALPIAVATYGNRIKAFWDAKGDADARTKAAGAKNLKA